MKRLLILILCPLLLCSCEQKPNGYLVSSVAVDYNGGFYNIWYEVIISNTEKADQKREILSYSARTLLEAIEGVEKQSTEPLLTSHCGVVIVGDGITRTKLRGIMRYCKENRDITLSVQLLRCKNPEKLIKTEPISSIGVGYDLVRMIKNQKPKNKTRLFEIYKYHNPILPRIQLTEKGYYFE